MIDNYETSVPFFAFDLCPVFVDYLQVSKLEGVIGWAIKVHVVSSATNQEFNAVRLKLETDAF